MSAFVPRWLPLALVALLALWLRTHDLAHRPMHTDEANQAVKAGQLLESGHYAFDPHDHHGPTLYYAVLPVAWLRGQRTLAELDETTVRLVPALAGTLAVILLGLFAAPLGRLPALAAAAFLAVSPTAVYYSRYFVQETLLATFALGVFVCTQRWLRRPGAGWALGAGACIGLMQATKASAPLFLVAAALAWLAIRRRAALRPLPAADTPALPPRHLLRDAALALAAALGVAALFYSSFGSHSAGLRDAFATYFQAAHRLEGGTGHEKPWWYYAHVLTWWRAGGLVFQQVAFVALAAAGLVLALLPRVARARLRPSAAANATATTTSAPRRAAAIDPAPVSASLRQAKCHLIDDTSRVFLRGVIVYFFIVAAVLSLTAYKTPWHAIHFVPPLALFAAGALAAVPRPWIAGMIALAVLTALGTQTRLAVFQRPADPRNPYAYVHSSPDVLKFRALANAALARSPAGVVRVIGEEYWPLPWYFRGLDRVGYWSTPPADCDGALVVATATQAETVRARMHGAYRESLLGLRPGVLCVVFTPR